MLQRHTHQTSKTIEELRSLKRDWDGRGSPKVPAKVLRTIEGVLTEFERIGLPFPTVNPKPGGGVSLLWSTPGRDLLLEFLPIGVTLYTQVIRHQDERSTTLQGNFIGQEPVGRLVAWYMMEFAKEA